MQESDLNTVYTKLIIIEYTLKIIVLDLFLCIKCCH